MVKPSGLRMTMPTQAVLRGLLEHPTREMYGLQVCEAAGLPSGTVHPILARLEGLGWLESRWEEVNPAEAGRPRRRYYRLSPDGAEQARHALANARSPLAGLAGWTDNPALGGAR
ncbi:PadR family transcriptional regulator [Plantactinospora soyae]|uniref:PadR family transcriptional regulator n=1 Tax=Plantactinospora soyae TaxID=1544732 RepID=UPI00298EE226|nr:helix-turn-helix transcriptional regulator [Plantactinospora soyae]